MGGVFSGGDAVELAAVGASAVALGTVLFADPLAPGRIRAEMAPAVAALVSEGLPADRPPLLSR
jgi:dihydroorotate dehydrogenase (NAD+) catalytic subunit